MNAKTFTLPEAQLQLSLSVNQIESWLIKKFSEQTALPESTISSTVSVTSLGLDSMDAVMIAGDLEEWLNIDVPSTLLWDYPTIGQISEYIHSVFSDKFNDAQKIAC